MSHTSALPPPARATPWWHLARASLSRAERLVHVEYADEADAQRAMEHLKGQGLERAEVRGSRLVGLLASRFSTSSEPWNFTDWS